MTSAQDPFPLFPAEPKALRQWVVWRFEAKPDKPDETTKVLYNPHTKRAASSTDPETWSSYAEVCAAYRAGRWDGIGFVFSKDDPYCGTDLDKCRDRDSEEIEPEAQHIIDTLDSYSELSPSETGVHIFTQAVLPPGGRKKGRVEMYDRKRYFTVTGRHLYGTPRTIESRQAEQEQVHTLIFGRAEETPAPAAPRPTVALDIDDEALIERAKHAKGGERFASLWDGDTAAYDGDESRADQALCNMLAFWTGGDERRIDSLFRQSGLYRDKWDQRRGDKGTYGEITIAKALSGARSYYDPDYTSHNGHNGIAAVELARPAVVERVLDRETDETPAGESEAPPLPAAATRLYRYTREGAGAWLDDYIAYAAQAAPMTPRSFHEMAGLMAGAIAIARRLTLKVSNTAVYPNLFALFIAPSTLYSKTTGFRVLHDLFARADLEHFLLPQRMTPEAMVQELSIGVPPNLNMADQEARVSWLKERALAAKRGWAIDEASSLFDSLKRDFNAGLMALMLNLYECPNKTTEQTVGRWRVTVHRAYISFFGAATPAAMSEHLANSALWTNGLWARFALIVPDEPPHFQFFPPLVETPQSVIEGLQRLARLFPLPSARLLDYEDPDGTKRKVVEIEGEEDPHSVALARGVWQAWEAYAHALHGLLKGGSVEAELHASYGRLHMHVMKVAMILAAMDATALPVTIQLHHLARAQEIVERWRSSLHRIRQASGTTQEEAKTDRVLAALLTAGADGLPTREIYRLLNISSREARGLLEEIARQGRIECYKAIATNGRSVEMWRRVFLSTSLEVA